MERNFFGDFLVFHYKWEFGGLTHGYKLRAILTYSLR